MEGCGGVDGWMGGWVDYYLEGAKSWLVSHFSVGIRNAGDARPGAMIKALVST